MDNQLITSIWGDEGFSAILSMRPIPEILKIVSQDTSPPLWNILLHCTFQLFGTSEVVIRSLSLIFYILAIIFTFRIGSILWSKKTGAIAASLTALNPFFFMYAFEGRMYSILALGVTASMYHFLKIITREKGEITKTTTKIGYVFWTLWALYSHHFATFALVAQGLWFLYEIALGNRKNGRILFKLFLFVGLGYIPWIWPLYMQITKLSSGFWLGKPDYEDLKILIYDYLAEGIKSLDYKIPLLNLPIHKLALYSVFGILLTRKWWKGIKKSLFLLLWFFAPIATVWIISQYFTSIFYNRYLLFTIPSAMLILASLRSKLSIIPISLTIIIFGIIDFHYFVNPTKMPFREYSAYVKNILSEDENIFLINWNSSAHHLWESKYYKITAPLYLPNGNNLPYYVGTALMTEEDIIRKLPNASKIGVITSGNPDEVVFEGYKKTEMKNFEGLKFLLFEKG
ncbi:MAG: glycosyltransferase family 39 protein [Patescibacteria group bacterium]|nr:glycosyltransferase family 39 protein [Patescibacteria group bacterium]